MLFPLSYSENRKNIHILFFGGGDIDDFIQKKMIITFYIKSAVQDVCYLFLVIVYMINAPGRFISPDRLKL